MSSINAGRSNASSLTPLISTPPTNEAPPFTSPSCSSHEAASSDIQHPQATFFIDPPRLNVTEKQLFKQRTDDILPLAVEVDDDIHEIIGEYITNNELFYFARYKEGLAHKFPAKAFQERFPVLVSTYEEKKNGNLSQFDPSTSAIHPDSRIHMVVNIKPKQAKVEMKALVGPIGRQQYVTIGSDSVSSLTDDESDNYQDSETSTPALKIRLRSTNAKSVKRLPFSPKKTRSTRLRAANALDDSEYGSDTGSLSRRQTRQSKRLRNVIDVDALSSNEASDMDDDIQEIASVKKGRGATRGKFFQRKPSRAAYGQIRDVQDLTDEEGDDPLSAHRTICEKCHKEGSHKLVRKKKPHGRRRKKEEFEESSDEDCAKRGGWVRCLKCPVGCHWGCLAQAQREEILKAIQDKDTEALERAPADPSSTKALKRKGLTVKQTTEFICAACMRGGVCIGCKEVALQPDPGSKKRSTGRDTSQAAEKQSNGDDVEMANGTEATTEAKGGNTEDSGAAETSTELLFRCLTCKSIAHYKHLPRPPDTDPEDDDLSTLALHYQVTNSWLCHDCINYSANGLDLILAWRPVAQGSLGTSHETEKPNYRSPLPREYLVKWKERSYRRTEWVPHMWLLSTHTSKLRNFIEGGAKVDLVKEAMGQDQESHLQDDPAPFEISAKGGQSASQSPGISPFDPMPDALQRIPLAWTSVDVVLDVLLWSPRKGAAKVNRKSSKSKRRQVESEEETGEGDSDAEDERNAAFELGEQPSEEYTETIRDWERRTGREFSIEHIDRVIWGFFKWGDLPYDQATWDSPPRPGEAGHDAFKTAMERFIASKKVTVPRRTDSEYAKYSNRPPEGFKTRHLLRSGDGLQLGQDPSLKLMPFQVDGFNWLCNNWWIRQPCILADEMGLGKTVQIASFLGYIMEKFDAMPALVVVPNSTITNWIRELNRWAPHLRAVPFYGDEKTRQIIKQYELSHDHKPSSKTTGSKFHILVTTYETLINQKEFGAVFKKEPRWEVLIVDEGQRLKNDDSLLFKKLNELNSNHRIIMTGTPLNNNIRELFNLMNFLDPAQWSDLEALEKEHEELTEELVKNLHNRLRPYFLRRIKSEVVKLPPKNEVIVPLSMAPLQKQVYRSIFSRNLSLLEGLVQVQDLKQKSKEVTKTKAKANLNNVLMELRKCLQHPYIVDPDIEPKNLSPQDVHEKLIDGSAKLRFLRTLLPKLKARGHRVLLFSQFSIALNVVEDFLIGERYKYLRLDGETKQAQRQKDMDAFNKPGSDIFVYLLTTRAGGVGINLWSADTVIIFDPDFNPHQDLQAIARAHRFGQKKTCLVFKLMVKDSAEERIMQVGKKKLVLDHLIVQKMDDDDDAGEDMKSIMTYGAKALFEEDADSRDITYSDSDMDKLIDKTEQEAEPATTEKAEGGLSFSFAKIWSADKDTLEEISEEMPADAMDSWTQTLQRLALEREQEKAQEITGRGARRRAAVMPQYIPGIDDSPEKAPRPVHKGKKGGNASDESAYSDKGEHEETSSSSGASVPPPDLEELAGVMATMEARLSLPGLPPPPMPSYSTKRKSKAAAVLTAPDYCGLCRKRHGDQLGDCPMTEKSENLAEYREMLMTHAGDEDDTLRLAAIESIEATLRRRGHLRLIEGQPLHFISGTVKTHLPKPKDVPHPVASSSKRPAPAIPTEAQRVKKRQKHPQCALCDQYHLLKDCPIVALGTDRIAQEIRRLDDDPRQKPLIDSLYKLLTKKKKSSVRENVPDTNKPNGIWPR